MDQGGPRTRPEGWRRQPGNEPGYRRGVPADSIPRSRRPSSYRAGRGEIGREAVKRLHVGRTRPFWRGAVVAAVVGGVGLAGPCFAGASGTTTTTAPLTLAQWKRRLRGDDRQDRRRRPRHLGQWPQGGEPSDDEEGQCRRLEMSAVARRRRVGAEGGTANPADLGRAVVDRVDLGFALGIDCLRYRPAGGVEVSGEEVRQADVPRERRREGAFQPPLGLRDMTTGRLLRASRQVPPWVVLSGRGPTPDLDARLSTTSGSGCWRHRESQGQHEVVVRVVRPLPYKSRPICADLHPVRRPVPGYGASGDPRPVHYTSQRWTARTANSAARIVGRWPSRCWQPLPCCYLLPSRFSALFPRWIGPLGRSGCFLSLLVLADPGRIDNRSPVVRRISLGLVVVLVAGAAMVSGRRLVVDLIHGGPGDELPWTAAPHWVLGLALHDHYLLLFSTGSWMAEAPDTAYR